MNIVAEQLGKLLGYANWTSPITIPSTQFYGAPIVVKFQLPPN